MGGSPWTLFCTIFGTRSSTTGSRRRLSLLSFSLQAKSARNFVASLAQRGVVSRLKPGLFILVRCEPEHLFGFTEVAKAFWMRRDDRDHGQLVDYVLRLDVGAVIRRLGFLLETFEVDAPRELERLQQKLTAIYAILDPLLPDERKFVAQWRLRLNVDPDGIVSVVRT